MNAGPESGGGAVRHWRRVAAFLLLSLVGMNLRTILLSVPPILPLIQAELGLSHTGVGLLTALPILVMGLGAWPAGLLVARMGGRRAVALGLGVLALGGLLRAVWPGILPLYSATVVLSLGIALAQTAIVALVRLWFPTRIGLASALYTDGIISGEALGAGLTLPLILRWLGHDAWRASFVAWSVPVIGVLALWLLLAPQDTGSPPAVRAARTAAIAPFERWPHLAGRRFGLMAVHLGLLSGSGSVIYFSMNAWTAPYNAALGHGVATPLTLAVLNASQLPVSFSITPIAQRLTGRRLPFVVSGIVCLIAIGGWAWGPWSWQPLWAALLGGSTVAVLTLGIALPPYFATRATVAPLVGATLSVSYGLSFLGQLVGGPLWDLAGRPIFAFLPVVAAALALVLLGALLPVRDRDDEAMPGPSLAGLSSGKLGTGSPAANAD